MSCDVVVEEEVDCVTKCFEIIDTEQNTSFVGKSIEYGHPVGTPLESMQELLKWKSDGTCDPGQAFSVASVPSKRKIKNSTSRKTLFCHDMMNNYSSDRFVQGAPGTDHYIFPFWSMIDTFIYFSHHLVTIPTVTWTNAAHSNGVAVLGTFITEWDDGFKMCKEFLKDDSSWKLVADQLVEVCKYYSFDGWLVNIENDIHINQMPALKNFVSYLTMSMHEKVEGSQVLWFDSVIKTGKLNWQSEINHHNEYILSCVDGIIVNYTWNESSLIRTRNQVSAKQDIYIGIDVFGRGCYGGGGMNSVEALKLIEKYELSSCIYAPGWTFEKFDRDYESMMRKNVEFWSKLAPHLESRPLHLPDGFCTSFYPGIGEMETSYDGKVLSGLNLGLQELQPVFSPPPADHRGMSEFLKVEVAVRGGEALVSIDNFDAIRFSIDTDRGRLLFENGQISKSCATEDFRIEVLDVASAVWSVGSFVLRSSRPFTITGLALEHADQCRRVAVKPITPDSSETLAHLLLGTNRRFQVEVCDASWRRKDCGSFYLSCTLQFSHLDSPVDIWYESRNISDPENREKKLKFLGRSNSKLYRVVDVKAEQISSPSFLTIFYFFMRDFCFRSSLKFVLKLQFKHNQEKHKVIWFQCRQKYKEFDAFR